MALRVLTDQQCRLDLRKLGQQMIEPQCRALTARRHVAAISPARITIAHRDDGDA